jgi:hypothetical protein
MTFNAAFLLCPNLEIQLEREARKWVIAFEKNEVLHWGIVAVWKRSFLSRHWANKHDYEKIWIKLVLTCTAKDRQLLDFVDFSKFFKTRF